MAIRARCMDSILSKTATTTNMTYTELLEQMPDQLTIPTLGGRASITVHNLGHCLMVENSKGSTYRLCHEDWINAKKIHAAYPRTPWKTSLYSEPSSVFSYGLAYAAALLRHIEPGDDDGTAAIRFHRKPRNQHAA